jgi:gliding motility-associated-like protein
MRAIVKRVPALLSLLVLSIVSIGAYSQNPYHINGSAFQENCNCYTLTPDELLRSGSVWNVNKISLVNSFDYKFNVNLGCRDTDGADGLVFVLQPISTSVGSVGGGLGFQGIRPSIGVAIDTWQNTGDEDPFVDHLAIHRDGDLNHRSSNNLAGPVTASNVNIEDCEWHVLQIVWNATTKRLSAIIDNKDSVHVVLDLVTSVFGGNPEVFWGFTGSTGGARNRQRFCTSLNPGIAALDAATVTCFPTPIQFRDSSVSFGNIVKWYWDFGDGTRDTVKTPPPHVFPAPGIYTVTMNILGNNGCLSDTFRTQVVVGSEPIGKFGLSPPLVCQDALVAFNDSSTVQFGTIHQWTWTLQGGDDTVTQGPGYVTSFSSAGVYEMQLVTRTKEGCISAPVSKTFAVNAAPQITMEAEDACFREPVDFMANNLDPSIQVSRWYWDLGNGNTAATQNVQYNYPGGGQYLVKLMAESANGCKTDTINRTVNIYSTNAFAGNDTVVTTNEPIQLRGTGGVLYRWSPATGLNNPDIANPVAIIQNDTRYVLTAYTPLGCATTDTVYLKALKGPAIYVPNAFTPNGDGRNDKFRFIPVGMKEIYYFRIFNRYGQLMYQSKTMQPGWDGTVNGKPAPAGSYVWMVSGKDFSDQLNTQKGTVVLIR